MIVRDNKITIRDLYPHLNDEQLAEAEENVERYLEVVLRIYQRLQADPEAYARFKALTAQSAESTLEVKRSNNP